VPVSICSCTNCPGCIKAQAATETDKHWPVAYTGSMCAVTVAGQGLHTGATWAGTTCTEQLLILYISQDSVLEPIITFKWVQLNSSVSLPKRKPVEQGWGCSHALEADPTSCDIGPDPACVLSSARPNFAAIFAMLRMTQVEKRSCPNSQGMKHTMLQKLIGAEMPNIMLITSSLDSIDKYALLQKKNTSDSICQQHFREQPDWHPKASSHCFLLSG